LKDELEYELACMGVKSTRNVQVLRKIFHFIQADDIPSNITILGHINVAEMYDLVCAKLGERENMASQLNSTRPLPVTRIPTRVAYLRNQLQHLFEWCSGVGGNL
jgi:hypothetical protein